MIFYSRLFWLLSRNWMGEGQSESWEATTVQLQIKVMMTLTKILVTGMEKIHKDRKTIRGDQGQEKAMAPHSSILAWKIPWMEEPGRLQSIGSLGVGHD